MNRERAAAMCRQAWRISLLALAVIPATLAAGEVKVLPPQFTLTGTEARQSLIVEQSENGHFAGPVSGDPTFNSSDPKVVTVQNGSAIPVGNGQATITAVTPDGNATAQVVVTGMDKPFQWSFRNHVQPVLMRMGCSTGACHGAAAGKAGFKLSLRGYDDDGDYRTITRQAQGRRVNLNDPGRSLLLTKPTTAVAHKGGQRFEPDSYEYRVLSEWIASGLPAPQPADPRIERIEILPPAVVLKSGGAQQLNVRAFFSDGHSEDVTNWTKYTSANTTVAQVEENGAVKVVGNGEGAITAWYLSRIAIATITVPYEKPVAAEAFTAFKPRNFIDELVLTKLKELNCPLSGGCSDSEFMRRAFVDTIGTLPKPGELQEFLADGAADKRDKLIESLLQRTEFADYWSYKWSDLLLVNSEKLNPAAMWSYYNWIRKNVSANTPWDKLAREVVTARGSTLENGAGNFFVLHDDPTTLAETTSLAFMGLSINCAKCHNHPMEKWTNNQYYGMANLYARVRAKNGSGDGDKVIFCASDGELIQPLTGKPQPPQPLDGKVLPTGTARDRREFLADWLVSRENPYFARAITNRIWANFFGKGLVESVDDLRVTNPASNEKLLSAAANALADNKFDLKSLMRAILQSETYQRSSQALPENATDTRFYSHYYPRRIMAEVLLDAISTVTGVPTEFPNYPKGWRAMQLPDSNVNSYFLKSFGRPNRLTTCDCERSAEPSMTQVLHIANGDTLNKKLEAPDNYIATLAKGNAPYDKILEDAYLAALSRPPTAQEKEKLLKIVESAGDAGRRQIIEDLYWSILSSKEFLFNH